MVFWQEPPTTNWSENARGLHHFSLVPIGNKSVFIQLHVQRVQCLCCGAIRQVKIHFSEWRRTYTKTFERYALALSRHMTILDVASHFKVGWDVIKDIQKRYLGKEGSKVFGSKG